MHEPDPNQLFPEGQGGGLYNFMGDPTIRNCVFIANAASHEGGAIYNEQGSPTFVNCCIRQNSAAFGGGMCDRGGYPTLTGCSFSGNRASQSGGGVQAIGGSLTLIDCTFSENSAGFGGAMQNEFDSYVELFNCTFFGNSAESAGGAVCSQGYPLTRGNVAGFVNCVFAGNSAGAEGAGICGVWTGLILLNSTLSNNSGGTGGGLYVGDAGASLFNCVLWGNTDASGSAESAQLHHTPDSTMDVWYTCLQGWTGSLGGKGNLAEDPLFKDPLGPDGVVGTDDDNLRLRIGSPCIDAGNTTAVPPDWYDADQDGDTAELFPFDLDGKSRFFDHPAAPDAGVADPPEYPDIVDMGAYEFIDVCGDDAHPYPPGDLNQDCNVDWLDIAIIAGHWLTCTAPECE